MPVLSPEQIAQYQQDGYTILKNALSRRRRARNSAPISKDRLGRAALPEARIEFDPNAPRQRHIDHLRKINGPSQCDPFFPRPRSA